MEPWDDSSDQILSFWKNSFNQGDRHEPDKVSQKTNNRQQSPTTTRKQRIGTPKTNTPDMPRWARQSGPILLTGMRKRTPASAVTRAGADRGGVGGYGGWSSVDGRETLQANTVTFNAATGALLAPLSVGTSSALLTSHVGSHLDAHYKQYENTHTSSHRPGSDMECKSPAAMGRQPILLSRGDKDRLVHEFVNLQTAGLRGTAIRHSGGSMLISSNNTATGINNSSTINNYAGTGKPLELIYERINTSCCGSTDQRVSEFSRKCRHHTACAPFSSVLPLFEPQAPLPALSDTGDALSPHAFAPPRMSPIIHVSVSTCSTPSLKAPPSKHDEETTQIRASTAAAATLPASRRPYSAQVLLTSHNHDARAIGTDTLRPGTALSHARVRHVDDPSRAREKREEGRSAEMVMSPIHSPSMSFESMNALECVSEGTQSHASRASTPATAQHVAQSDVYLGTEDEQAHVTIDRYGQTSTRLDRHSIGDAVMSPLWIVGSAAASHMKGIPAKRPLSTPKLVKLSSDGYAARPRLVVRK